eukprot:5616617-Ditylum_brightwellii.AAC.1
MAITRAKKNMYVSDRLESQFDQLRQFFRMNGNVMQLQTDLNTTYDYSQDDKQDSYKKHDKEDSTDDENENEYYNGHRVPQSQETPIGSINLLQDNRIAVNGSPEKKY